MTGNKAVACGERIESNIFFIRGQRVMLSIHLAEMYEVEPQKLDMVIERHSFPADCMFRLNHDEFASLLSRPSGQATPYAFTSQGVALLASVLFDERAIHEDSCAPSCSCRR